MRRKAVAPYHWRSWFPLLYANLFLIHCFITAQPDCPPVDPPCRCAPSIHEPVAIVCENAGSLDNALRAIANAKGQPIDSLAIVDTAISVVPANSFIDFLIIRLVLNRNALSQIDADAFRGPLIESLVELDLSDNRLERVPQLGVAQLRNLRKLYLNRNRIAKWLGSGATAFDAYASRDVLLKLELAGNQLTDGALTTDAFRALRALRELSLETNALTAVPSAALQSQRDTLTNLNLGLNQIRDVPVGALNFPQLNSLSLEFNGIGVIIPQAFQGVPHLQYLYLTGNKFPAWQPEMYRFINELRTLGIGETPISVIPSNAFIHTPNLMRLEMSEAAVDTIEPGAFQRTPFIQAIVLNKNRLMRIDSETFHGLFELYSIDLQGNRLELIKPLAFANLPNLRHLDISYNQLTTMPPSTFDNSFEPLPDDRRVIYACANPWLCDSRLEWFRRLLRDNLDIDVDKPGCVAQCAQGVVAAAGGTMCPPAGQPLRAPDICPIADYPLPLAGTALSLVGWIILVVILTILMISLCLMALIRYGMSHRRKKEKVQEMEDEQQIISSAASNYYAQQQLAAAAAAHHHHRQAIGGVDGGSPPSIAGLVDLDLPVARTLDDRPNYFI